MSYLPIIIFMLAGPITSCLTSAISLSGQLWKSKPLAHMLGWLGLFASFLALLGAIMLLQIHDAGVLYTSLSDVDTRLLVDALSIYFILLVNVIAFVSSWNAISFLEQLQAPNRWQSAAFFHCTSQLFHITMVLVALMNDLVSLWIAMQATTLVSTLLVGFERSPMAREAAWKYVLITSTGIIFALLGTMFLARAAGNNSDWWRSLSDAEKQSVMHWIFLLKNARYLDSNLVQLSFLLILVGYGTKAGFAPMHTWLPDGHGESPAPVSAMLSGVLLKSALYAILRFYILTNAVLGNNTFTSSILLGVAMLSLIVATPFILKANRFKRILAYHSLEHMGIITFGIGIGGRVALFGALLHVLNHALTKALMFLAYGNIMRSYAVSGQNAQQPSGVLRYMPATGLMLTLGGLALVGMPPFSIFMSELIMLWGAISGLELFNPEKTSDLWILHSMAILVFLVSTTLIFYGLIRHLTAIVLKPEPLRGRLREPWFELAPLLLLMLPISVFGLWIIPSLARLIAQSVEIVIGR